MDTQDFNVYTLDNFKTSRVLKYKIIQLRL